MRTHKGHRGPLRAGRAAPCETSGPARPAHGRHPLRSRVPRPAGLRNLAHRPDNVLAKEALPRRSAQDQVPFLSIDRHQATGTSGQAGSRVATLRRVLAWACGILGLITYNWWVLVPLKPGLMKSPNEFFSNLEVAGQSYASVMSHCDVAAGLLVLAAFLLAGQNSVARSRREWLGMLVFALAGLIGGLFSQVCADGISAACMNAERHFQLPLSQYVHDGAGVFEFTGITLTLLLALRRTRGERTVPARIYRLLGVGACVAYPLLGLAYLFNRLGGVIEGVFFTGFTIMVLTQLAERLRSPRLSPDHNESIMEPWVSSLSGPARG
jgi:hypothetical protein